MAYEWFMHYAHLATGTGQAALTQGDGALDLVGTGSSVQIVDFAGERGLGSGAQTDLWRKDLPTALTEITLGFRYRRDASNSRMVVSLYTGTTLQLNVFMDGATGNLSVRRGTTVLASGLTTLASLTRYYIELSCKIDGVDGDWTLRVDGAQVGTGSTVNTGSAGVDNVRGHGDTAGTNVRAWYASQYIRERPAGANGFYGPLVFNLLAPTSDVSKQWTPSAGTDNYAMVDDATPDGDTTYVETATLGHEDQYETANLPAGLNSIVALVVGTVAFAPSGGAPAIQHTLEIDATKASGTARTIGVAGYRTQLHAFTRAPDNSALTEAKVNSARIGIIAA